MSDAPSPATDLLGTPLTKAEQGILSAYRQVETLLDQDLSPAIRANVQEAVACLWQAVNDLCLTDDRPDV